MSQLTTLTKQLAAASANAIALTQTPVSGTPLTLNGSTVSGGVATLDTSRRVLLTYGNEGAARTLLISGTNGDGASISETLAVPSGAGGTVATLQDFETVISALPAGGGWTAAITLGTNGTGSTRWWVPNFHIDPFEVAVGFAILSGAVTASVEICDTSPLPPLYGFSGNQAPPVPTPIGWPGMTALAAAAQSVINRTCAGIRLTITAGAGQGQLTLRQSGIRN